MGKWIYMGLSQAINSKAGCEMETYLLLDPRLKLAVI
jgi:hypothetical protein